MNNETIHGIPQINTLSLHVSVDDFRPQFLQVMDSRAVTQYFVEILCTCGFPVLGKVSNCSNLRLARTP